MNNAFKTQQKNDEQAINERLETIKRTILVLSGKGGVGKSTVAVNLAAELARNGKSVGLLDIDFHGPSIPSMLGMNSPPVLYNEGAAVPIKYHDNLSVMSIGFLLKERGDAVIWRGPMKYGVIKQFIADVEWGKLDYLVIDSPPGTGDEPLSVVQMTLPKASAVVVTTPQRVSIDDVRKSVNFCRKLELPVAGIIENMSGYVCPHCGKRVDIFDTGGGESLAKEMNVPFLGKIPIVPGIVEACDHGTPFVLNNGHSETVTVFRSSIEQICELDDTL